MILVVGDHQLHPVDVLQRVGIQVQLIEVGAHLAAAEQTDGTRIGGRLVAGVLERFPATLQEQPMLRIGERRIARREAEELGVELVDVVEQRRGIDVTGQP